MKRTAPDRDQKNEPVPHWVAEQLRELHTLAEGPWPARRPSPVARGIPPDPDLVEVCWRAANENRDEILCGIYRSDVSLQLRARLGRDVIDSDDAGGLAQARLMAAEWRRAANEDGFTGVQ